MKAELQRIVGEVVKAYQAHKWIAERRYLRDRPWLEETLHWSRDGQLHGHIAPAPNDHRSSVTSDGWCLGLAPQPRVFDS